MVEEEQPASPEWLRITEPRGRELAWMEAVFVVGVLTLILVGLTSPSSWVYVYTPLIC